MGSRQAKDSHKAEGEANETRHGTEEQDTGVTKWDAVHTYSVSWSRESYTNQYTRLRVEVHRIRAPFAYASMNE